MSTFCICVHADHRGGWEVRLPHDAEPLRCDTLDEAERAARRVAPATRRCDLVVHDAYERVLYRDVLEPQRPGFSPATAGASARDR
jgi:hypothetical protein